MTCIVYKNYNIEYLLALYSIMKIMKYSLNQILKHDKKMINE